MMRSGYESLHNENPLSICSRVCTPFLDRQLHASQYKSLKYAKSANIFLLLLLCPWNWELMFFAGRWSEGVEAERRVRLREGYGSYFIQSLRGAKEQRVFSRLHHHGDPCPVTQARPLVERWDKVFSHKETENRALRKGFMVSLASVIMENTRNV